MRRAVARNKKTPCSILLSLLDTNDRDIKCSISWSNSNTEILSKLLFEDDSDVIRNTIMNPNLERETLISALEKMARSQRILLAENSGGARESISDIFLDDKDIQVVLASIQNGKHSPSAWEKCLHSNRKKIRNAVLSIAPDCLLQELLYDYGAEIAATTYKKCYERFEEKLRYELKNSSGSWRDFDIMRQLVSKGFLYDSFNYYAWIMHWTGEDRATIQNVYNEIERRESRFMRCTGLDRWR